MLDLQPDHFAGTQAAPTAKTECHAGLEACFGCAQQLGRFQVKADIMWQAGPAGSVENDPIRT